MLLVSVSSALPLSAASSAESSSYGLTKCSFGVFHHSNLEFLSNLPEVLGNTPKFSQRRPEECRETPVQPRETLQKWEIVDTVPKFPSRSKSTRKSGIIELPKLSNGNSAIFGQAYQLPLRLEPDGLGVGDPRRRLLLQLTRHLLYVVLVRDSGLTLVHISAQRKHILWDTLGA